MFRCENNMKLFQSSWFYEILRNCVAHITEFLVVYPFGFIPNLRFSDSVEIADLIFSSLVCLIVTSCLLSITGMDWKKAYKLFEIEQPRYFKRTRYHASQ